MKRIIWIFSILFFFLPFVWLQPGQVNLGGDSSRLYFYDPLNYLKTFPLYNIAPGQTGFESISYFFLPFTLFSLLLKLILQSPWLVISVFHGIMLSTSFIFVALSVQELLQYHEKDREEADWAAIIAGILYVIAPMVWNWDKAIISHNQLFLNPLMFYLFLRYVHTNRSWFVMMALLISVVFAPNFSFIAAPPLFAFYPLALLYLLVYKRWVAQTPFRWFSIIGMGVLFVLLHAFQLIPQLYQLVNPQSNLFQRVFSAESASAGLQNFTSVANSVSLAKNLALIVSTEKSLVSWDIFLFVFPAILIAGFLMRGRFSSTRGLAVNMTLLACCFFIALFFDTAKVTQIGFSFYQLLFNLPGFSMFRNFYGQFIYVYTFFFVLLLGHALYFILRWVGKPRRQWVIGVLLLILLGNGWPFFTGYMIHLPILGSVDTAVPFRMDPEFEKVLQYIRELPIDGRVLTLPLTDYGYQLLAGTDKGVYIGPSFIGYLTGKKDFMGYNAMAPFSELFVQLVKEGNYEGIQKLLSWLNIRYIFYNANPRTYEKFLQFPYTTMKTVFPTLESIQVFIKKLNPKEVYRNGYYTVYETAEEKYLPHIFVAKKDISSSLSPQDMVLLLALFGAEPRAVFHTVKKDDSDQTLIKANKVDIYQRAQGGTSVIYPFAKWPLSSVIYPFIDFKEQHSLRKFSKSDDAYVDRLMFYAGKRVFEIDRWGNDLQVLHQAKDRESLHDYWNAAKGENILPVGLYNTWESILARYEDYFRTIDSIMERTTLGASWKLQMRTRVLVALKRNQNIISNRVKTSQMSDQDKEYILSLLKDIYNYYVNKFHVPEYEVASLEYTIDDTNHRPCCYNIYVQKDQNGEIDFHNSTIEMDGEVIGKPKDLFQQFWVMFNPISLPDKGSLLKLHIPIINIGEKSSWHVLGEPKVTEDISSTRLTSAFTKLNRTDGFIRRIEQWELSGHYLLSLDFNSHGENIAINLYARQKFNASSSTKMKNEYSQIYHEVNISDGWKNFRSIIESINYQDVIIQITSQDIGNHESIIDIRNLSVIKLPPHPDMIFVRNPIYQTYDHVPSLTFTRVNPTKYLVQVRGATNPYTLVFLEAYNPNWKIYFANATNGKILSRTMVWLAKITKASVGLFRKSEIQNSIRSTYFQNEVEEIFHKDTFFNADLFDSWNQAPIADNKHLLVNSYANAWHLDPKDVNGESDYTLIIEMKTQRLFYIALMVSSFTFLLVFGGLILRYKSVFEKPYRA